MARHAAPRRQRVTPALRSTRLRALLSVGIVVGVSAPGTLAYWSDAATMSGGDFTSGVFDLELSGNEGSPTAWANVAFTLDKMLPGESKAVAVTVDNTGDAAFTWSATGAAAAGSTGTTLAPDLLFEVVVGGAVTGSGRTTDCSAGTTLGPKVLSAVPVSVVSSGASLAAAATQGLCIVARLPATAPNSAQGKSAAATFVFSAVQVPVA